MVSSTSMSLSYANNDTSLFDRVDIVPSASDSCRLFPRFLERTQTIIPHPWRKKSLSQVSIRAVGHPEPLRRSTDEDTLHSLSHSWPLSFPNSCACVRILHTASPLGMSRRTGWLQACLSPLSATGLCAPSSLLAHTTSPVGVENPQLPTV